MIPRQEVQDAFLATTSHITRRVEIYEQDGQTPWRQELWPEILAGGSISSDNSADERRTLDLTLYNPNSELDPTIGKLWYDKVFKVFYGVEIPRRNSATRVAIVEAPSQECAGSFMAAASSDGVEVVYRPMHTLAQLASFDVLVAISGEEELGSLRLLNEAYAQGISIMTCAPVMHWRQAPLILSGVGPVTTTLGTELLPSPNQMLVSPVGWTVEPGEPARAIEGIVTGTEVLLSRDGLPAAVARGGSGEPKWVHLQQARFGADDLATEDDMTAMRQFLSSVLRWADILAYATHWEAQLGEYVQDSASTSSENPNAVEITGRDYVKRCLLSKLVAASTYDKGRSIESVIHTMAINSGIRKLSLPSTGVQLPRDMTWEADVSRWEIMKELATDSGYDIHFNLEGILVMEKFRDPTTSPIDLNLDVGRYGNLISRGLRTSDSQLFNHVVVVGESADEDTPPAWGEARNTNPESPSNIEELGNRVIRHQAATITSNAEARERARTMLSVAALEEFELDFSTPLLPWVEPNHIVGLTPEAAGTWGPDRFLLSSLSMPLDLSPMTGTGKRIINVT